MPKTSKGTNGFKWITLEEFNNAQCHHRSTAGPAFLIGIIVGGKSVIGLGVVQSKYGFAIYEDDVDGLASLPKIFLSTNPGVTKL